MPTQRQIMQVFSNKKYALLCSIASLLVFFVIIIIANWGLVIGLFNPSIPLEVKKIFIYNFPFIALENTTPTLLTLNIIISILVGLNITLFVYYINKVKNAIDGSGVATGSLGLIFGAIGIGCLSCGSILIGAILTAVGATAGIAIFPLHGLEFSIISIVLLGASALIVAKKINKGLTC